MKERICKAFCSELGVHEIPGGYGISTPYKDLTGDPLGFYVLGPDEDGFFKIIDSGFTVALLEAGGADLESQTRRDAFANILNEYGASYDEDGGSLSIAGLSEPSIPASCLGFMALLMRLKDLMFMTQERVSSTFREDVVNRLKAELEGKAIVREDEPVSAKLTEISPDLVMQAQDRVPVALFVGSGDNKLWQAIHLHTVATYETKEPLLVAAILEYDTAVSQKVRTLADNRLDAVPRYRSDENAAITRIIREVLGSTSVH